jgi:hypothetical protein
MSKIIECSMMPIKSKEILQGIGMQKEVGKPVLLSIFHSANDTSENITVGIHHNMNLQFTDKIICFSGVVMIILKTSTATRNFFLCPDLPLRNLEKIEKYKVILEINEETTKRLPDGIKTNLSPSDNIRRMGGGIQS